MADHLPRKIWKPNAAKNDKAQSEQDASGAACHQPRNGFVELPLEILCEIFKLLHPLDLLQLARTAKFVRKFLMNRASKSLWTYTLSAVKDLPPCPDDLSEPRYTHLIFSIYCHDCLQTLSELVKGGEELLLYLEARTRLCRACSLKHFNHWNGLPENVAPSLAGFVPATTNPLTNVEIKSRVYFGKKCKDPQRVNDKRSRFCIDSALRLHSEYQTIIGTQAKRAWMENQRKLWASKAKHARACEEYFQRVKEREKERKEELKEQRLVRIREKLKELGWSEEINISGGHLPAEVYSWNRSSPAQELSDEEWESVKDRMVGLMERSKEDRLRVDTRRRLLQRISIWVEPAYTSFFFSQPPDTIIPTLHEVCMSDAFRTPLCTLPLDQELSAELFETAVAQIPTFAEEWRNHRIEQVLALVRKSSTYRTTPANEVTADKILHLASSIFSCSDCHERITYPSVLTHQCLFGETSKIEDYIHAMPTPIEPQEIHICGVPSITSDVSLILLAKPTDYISIWRGLRAVKFDDEAHRHVLSMLDALGWCPTKTTVEDMERKQPYVECLCQCFWEPGFRPSPIIGRSNRRTKTRHPALNKLPLKRKAARWIKAIQMCRIHRYSEPHPECFAKLEGQDLVLATTQKEQLSGRSWSKSSVCFMCMTSRFFTGDLEAHFTYDHKVDHPGGIDGMKAYVSGVKKLQRVYLHNTEPYVELGN